VSGGLRHLRFHEPFLLFVRRRVRQCADVYYWDPLHLVF
jgi:hypothetical protein